MAKGKHKAGMTRAVTQIRVTDANAAKQTLLDDLGAAYLDLCQRYVTAFTTTETPNKFADATEPSPLSQRWQRVAIQQSAGIARSWRTNRERVFAAHQEALAEYERHKAAGTLHPKANQPEWAEWNTPVLKQMVLQANANVAVLEPSQSAHFDYWLRVSVLDAGKPLWIPITLAAYHHKALAGQTPDASVTLSRKRDGSWWLTLTVTEQVERSTTDEAAVVGVDVGIASFLTSSDGKQYGSFHGTLAARHKRDRDKRQRKAKLRACLKTKGTGALGAKLPSTSSASGQRLGRHVRQEINHAVNQFYSDHPGARIAYENLNVATMRFKARRMNAYLYASNLGHVPRQLAWGARKRGMDARTVWAAYSSQACTVCSFVERANRPNQQTFCCGACGHTAHADHNAAVNLQQRWDDHELQVCATKEEVKALLLNRHSAWKQTNPRFAVVEPPAELDPSTGVGHHLAATLGKYSTSGVIER